MIWMGGQIQGHKVREIFRNQRRGQKLEKPGCPRENTHGTPGGGNNQECFLLFIRLLALSLAAHRHSSRVRADSSGW